MERSRKLRRVQKRTPGGETRQYYLHRKARQASCAKCGSVLHGTPRTAAIEMKKMSKTMKKPKRMFGGNLCSRCMRAEIVRRARQ
jgi:large subunit ribosomal protein L34e